MGEIPTNRVNGRPSISGRVRIRWTQWRFGLLAACAISLLSLYPQLQLWLARGEHMSQTVAYNQGLGDEVAYAAYLNALIDGRPRRNDPYSGRDHSLGTPQQESLFSIQFFPAYVIALPARALGISAATMFIILTPLVALVSSLALFWLIQAVTSNHHLAAAGVVVVFCLGALTAAEGAVANWTGANAHFDFLPFLRRYQPASSFPLLLMLCLLTWRGLTVGKSKVLKPAVGTGALLCLLIFSYFYLWTAAAAWLLTLGALWLIFLPGDWAGVLKFFAGVTSIAAAALVPYVMLIRERSESVATVQALVFSREPDLFSMAQFVGAIVLLVLVIGVFRKSVDRRDRRVIFAASFAVLPFVVLNQQLITGRVLQPIHYKGFVTNYSVLIAIVLTTGLLWRRRNGQPWKVSSRALLWIALAALDWGFIETHHAAARGFVANYKAAEEMAVYARLEQIAPSEGVSPDQKIVLFSDLRMADGAPVASSLPVMWAPHLVVYTGTTPDESKQRLYKHLYYTGVGPRDLEDYLFGRRMYYGCAVGLFGFDRFIDGLNPNAKPITRQEKMDELVSYQQYATGFDWRQASDPRLAYVVSAVDEHTDFSNLDRWYRREVIEEVGKFVLYRVWLKDEVLEGTSKRVGSDVTDGKLLKGLSHSVSLTDQ